MPLKSQIIRNIEDLPIKHDSWDQLVSQNEINTIFQTYDWLDCWWSVYGEKDNLFTIIIRDENDQLTGIAPLCIRTNKVRELVFIGDGNADYVDFLIVDRKEEVIHKIFEVVKQHQQQLDHFILRNIPEYSSTYAYLNVLVHKQEYNLTIIQKIVCPSLVAKNRGHDADRVVNKYSVKRPYNYFRKLGEVEHVIMNDIQHAQSHIEKFFNQHIERWKGTPNPSLFNDKTNQEFYKNLLNKLLPKQQLLFSTVLLDNTPLSYHFGFDYNATVTWYKPSYAVEYARKSPGTLLVKYLIEYVLKNSRRELDFTIGDEPFKDRFSNVYRYNVTLMYFSNSADFKRFNIKRKIKNFVKLFIKR